MKATAVNPSASSTHICALHSAPLLLRTDAPAAVWEGATAPGPGAARSAPERLHLPPPRVESLQSLDRAALAARIFDSSAMDLGPKMSNGSMGFAKSKHRNAPQYSEAELGERARFEGMLKAGRDRFVEQLAAAMPLERLRELAQMRHTAAGRLVFDKFLPARESWERRNFELADRSDAMLYHDLVTLCEEELWRPEAHVFAAMAALCDSDDEDSVETAQANAPKIAKTLWNRLGWVGVAELVQFFNSDLGGAYVEALRTARKQFDVRAWVEAFKEEAESDVEAMAVPQAKPTPAKVAPYPVR